MLLERSIGWLTATLFSTGCLWLAEFDGGASSGGGAQGGGNTISTTGSGGSGGFSGWPACQPTGEVDVADETNNGFSGSPLFFFMTKVNFDQIAPVYISGDYIYYGNEAPIYIGFEPTFAVLAAISRTGIENNARILAANELSAYACEAPGAGCGPTPRPLSARFHQSRWYLRVEDALVTDPSKVLWSVSGNGPFAIAGDEALVVSESGLVACPFDTAECSGPTTSSLIPTALYETWDGSAESKGYPLYASFEGKLFVASQATIDGPVFEAVANAPLGVVDVVVGPAVDSTRKLLIHHGAGGESLSVCQTFPNDPTRLQSCCVQEGVAPHLADVDVEGHAWAVSGGERVQLEIPSSVSE